MLQLFSKKVLKYVKKNMSRMNLDQWLFLSFVCLLPALCLAKYLSLYCFFFLPNHVQLACCSCLVFSMAIHATRLKSTQTGDQMCFNTNSQRLYLTSLTIPAAQATGSDPPCRSWCSPVYPATSYDRPYWWSEWCHPPGSESLLLYKEWGHLLQGRTQTALARISKREKKTWT